MDFATRNLYRSGIEDLARRSSLTELQIAQALMAALAQGTGRRRDPGYHLIAGGRRAFEKTVGYRTPRWRLPGRWLARREPALTSARS